MTSTTSSDADQAVELVWRDRDQIFFHDDINTQSAVKLIKTVSEFVNESKKRVSVTARLPLFLHICSGGGCAFSGFMLYDHLRSLKDTICLTTVAEGLCASAATFLLLAGEARLIRPSALILIHQIRSSSDPFVYQTLSQSKEELQNNQRVQEIMRKIYDLNTTIPVKKMDELLLTEQYLDSNECRKYGLSTDSTDQTLSKIPRQEALKRKRR